MPFSTGKGQCFKLPTEKLKNFWISELTQGFWRTDLLSQSKDSETCKQHLTTRLNQWRAHSLTTYSFLHFKHIDSTALLTWESGLFDIKLFLWFRIPAFISPWTSLRGGQFPPYWLHQRCSDITSPTALLHYETTTVTDGNVQNTMLRRGHNNPFIHCCMSSILPSSFWAFSFLLQSVNIFKLRLATHKNAKKL